ncbi:aspartate kinase [uncultured Ruminococcus sp.]|uniref:aspartate kinase n=1 Tax=uncultured Ruminococcus sp. TaxID=165186 RepID=UPI00266F84BF|nr:aspartate kinase [uncultured Ruminococcus sp.]
MDTSMAIKVVKFGGSSLADAKQIQKAAAIIQADPQRRYVVPSAPGKRFSGDTKVTDMLYACYALAEAGVEFQKELEAIQARYDDIIAGLGIQLSLADEFAVIAENFRKRAGKDYAASRGEYLNGKVIATYLGFPFVDAADVIFFQPNGSLDDQKTEEALRARLTDLKNAVIPGFYGCGADGYVKTFSRGGSDVTGSIVAGAVKAALYENWTDVSGFLVADPRIVENPAVIRTITYTELRELSYMGASVLHEAAIFPVRAAGIPINIRNTNAPEEPGTMIVPDSSDEEVSAYTITGIAGKKQFTSINIHKDLMNSQIGFCRDVLSVLADHQIPLEHMPSSIDSMTVIVDTEHLKGIEEQIRTEIIKAVQPDSMDVEENIALIAVVGRGMCRTRGVAARIFAALAHARINVRMIDQGSSELNVIVAVKEADFEQAIRCIYDMFVNSVAE